MTQEQFIKTMIELQALDKTTDRLNNAFKEFEPDFNFISFSRYQALVVNMLKNVFDDKDDWIGYWLYELDYGSKWKKDMVTDKNGDVKLKTIKDLYKILSK